MADEKGQLDKRGNELPTSPERFAVWHNHARIKSAYAWFLLNHSWLISPSIPSDNIRKNPRIKIWDDARGWMNKGPYTLTVFCGYDELIYCRHAIWQDKKTDEIMRQFVEFINGSGELQTSDPIIEVGDSQVPYTQFYDYLRKIAACTIPAISLQDPRESSVSTDVGSMGFEYFSLNQPPAAIKYQWADTTPREWEPILNIVNELREFLMGYFK